MNDNQDLEYIQKNTDAIGLHINALSTLCHANSYAAGWWHDPHTGVDLMVTSAAPYVIATKCTLIHTEISEAVEGHRMGIMDEKLPHRSAMEVELADAIIRICDLAGQQKLDLGGAIAEKLAFNKTRPDHRVVTRRKAGGKLY